LTKRFLLFFTIVLFVAGCGQLDNKTEEDAVQSFVDALIKGDNDKVDALTSFDDERQKEILSLAKDYHLHDADPESCEQDKSSDLNYHVLCTTTDDKPLFMNLELTEKEDRYVMNDITYGPAEIVFREDDPKLTKELIQETEERIDGDIHKTSDEDRETLRPDIYKIGSALEGIYRDKPEDIVSHIDLDWVEEWTGETFTEEEAMETILEEDLGYGDTAQVETTDIQVASTYDLLYLHGALEGDVALSDLYEQYFTPDINDVYLVNYDFKINETEDETFSVYLHKNKEEWKIFDIFPMASPLESVAFKLPEMAGDDFDNWENDQSEDSEEPIEGETADSGEWLYETNCAACHGADLSGGAGPDIRSAGSDFSEAELKDIIINGTGSMPALGIEEGDAKAIAEWLAKKE